MGNNHTIVTITQIDSTKSSIMQDTLVYTNMARSSELPIHAPNDKQLCCINCASNLRPAMAMRILRLAHRTHRPWEDSAHTSLQRIAVQHGKQLKHRNQPWWRMPRHLLQLPWAHEHLFVALNGGTKIHRHTWVNNRNHGLIRKLLVRQFTNSDKMKKWLTYPHI